jgi:hypothetical protein
VYVAQNGICVALSHQDLTAFLCCRLNMVYLGLTGKLPEGNVVKNLPHLTHM